MRLRLINKILKATHSSIPNYLESMEEKRKEKDVIPDDFISDEEVKEESQQFKPPKPMKPGKRGPPQKSNSNHSGKL